MQRPSRHAFGDRRMVSCDCRRFARRLLGGAAPGAFSVLIAMNATGRTIRRDELWWKLARAAQVRSRVTMVSSLPLAAIVMSVISPGPWRAEESIVAFFGGFLVIGALMTKFYCRRAVTCPVCGASPWDCGTGNFKPRRMRLRTDVHACPNCGTPIS